MKEYSVTLTISVNVTVNASSQKEAKRIAIDTPLDLVSEFDRKVDMIEDITPTVRKVKRGRGSY